MFAAVDVVNLALTAIVLIAVAAIVMWFVRSSGVVIPQPVMIVIYAVVALVMIIILADLIGRGPGLLS